MKEPSPSKKDLKQVHNTSNYLCSRQIKSQKDGHVEEGRREEGGANIRNQMLPPGKTEMLDLIEFSKSVS